MTYEQGQTLSQLLKRHGKIPELELKAIVKAIFTGLHHIHEQDYYHRDIKPGNIYLRKQGDPVLIDFGAARQAIGARSRSLTNIVSAGYAPSEQYGSNQSKQGAWSDLYAVGATMYKSISGQEPTDAPTRQNALFEQDPDPLTPAIEIAKGHYTEELLQLIDWMLAPAIKNRPQNVHQVLAKEQQVQQAQKLQSIQSLLSQAENDIKQMRLSSPRGNNAVDKYQQVLQLEANNQLALKGLTAIIEKYLAMAETAQQQKHYQKARQLLKKAKIIQPENNEITLAERQLNTAETSYQQEQAKLAEQAKQRQAEKARLAAQRIKIGSTGPSGGIVFYVDSSGKHGLEAKSSDYTKQPGDMDYKDGAYYTWTHAVTAGKSYGSGWHLPSKRELNLLYKQKDVVGGFANRSYWSSTESGSGEAWVQAFNVGFQDDTRKYGTLRVRAVRAF